MCSVDAAVSYCLVRRSRTFRLVYNQNHCSGSVGDWLNSLSLLETTNKIEMSKFTKKRAQLQSIVNKNSE